MYLHFVDEMLAKLKPSQYLDGSHCVMQLDIAVFICIMPLSTYSCRYSPGALQPLEPKVPKYMLSSPR